MECNVDLRLATNAATIHRMKSLVIRLTKSFLHVVAAATRSNCTVRKSRVVWRMLCCERLEIRELLAIGDLRIANYNVRGFDGTPSTDVGTILQAIGNESYNGRSRPIDVVAIQEVQSQTTTTASVVAQLNAKYGAGRYSRGSLNGGSLSGNETMGLIFNTQTIQLVAEVGVGSTSSTGAARQPIRYQLRPLELPAGNDFYLYNSHYKASDTASDKSRRNVEATSIRTNADALGQGALVIYAGDFNLKTSTETAYQTLLASGAGQGLDPLNRPGNWNGNAAFKDIFTQAPAFSAPSGYVGGGINDRFDFQLLTGEWTDGVGLEYAPNSYHTFANNGSVNVNGSINDASNTALAGMANRATVLNLLTTVTDHLPLVVDYYFASNLAPTDLAVSANSVDENAATGTILGTLTSTDPNATDSHTYSLVSGTGSTNNSSFAIVGNTLRTSSTFALDGTANYSIRVRTTDAGGLTFEKSLTVRVNNVAPAIAVSNQTVAGNEGTTLLNAGTYSDILSDTVSITASVGSIVKNANGTWNWTLAVADDTATTTVTVTAIDEDGGSRNTTFTYSVSNAVPVITRSVISVSGNVLTTILNTGTWFDVPADVVTLTASLGTLTKNANGTWGWSYVPTGKMTAQLVTILASDEDGGSATVTFLVDANVAVTNSKVYYKGSAFANSGNDIPSALDTSKVLAVPGAVSQKLGFSNVITATRGINGLVFDVAGLVASSLTSADFLIRMSPTGSFNEVSIPPASWTSASTPSLISVTPATSTVAARVRLEWLDSAIANRWLQVIIKANTNTGLVAPAVFYLGSAVGEINGVAPYRILNADMLLVQSAIGANTVPITDARDINKDKRITNADMLFLLSRVAPTVVLNDITIPPAGSPDEGSGG